MNEYLPPHGHLPTPADSLACRKCSAMTSSKVLSLFGGQCEQCYEAYRQEPFVQKEPTDYAKKVQAYNAKWRRGEE